MKGMKVKTVGGFIENECFWAMNQCPADKEPPGFTGRHLVHRAVFQVPDIKERAYLIAPLLHFIGYNPVIQPDAREKA